MDWDKNGYITPIEFKSYLSSLKKGEEMDTAEVYEAFDRLDIEGTKQIRWEEFLVSLFISTMMSPCTHDSPFKQ